MIFPIGDDQVIGGHKPYLSYCIIAINIVLFAQQFLMTYEELQSYIFTYGCIPINIMHGKGFETLITSLFIHGGLMHLVGNMIFLWVFADNIEASIGNFKFLIFYIVGGIIANLTHIFIYPTSEVPCVGASGSIAAVLGAYLVMFPKSRIELTFLFIFSNFRISAFFFIGIWIIQQIISGMAEIGPSSSMTSGVAWWVHIGGFAFGLLSGIYFKTQVGEIKLSSKKYDD
ncbi:MAG: rhomboid family intramembrane serine protease [Saprospiraceae bacterium]|nr:rhomboid family intramembrane serine protease [Saprospiraceae bacterium]